jgi:hypothetical protein
MAPVAVEGAGLGSVQPQITINIVRNKDEHFNRK